jgi:Ca-activated chloride channel family protein
VTFLAPIPAIVAACITVPALLTFYFLKLRRRPVRVSSTLLWMQATSDLQVNVPFRMIRASWLLLLQLLILACLLAALGRPAVRMDSAPPGRAVILIDRSASMGAADGVGGAEGETRLDEAKRRAIVIADRLGRGGGTVVSVVAYAAEARTVIGFTSDRAAVREAIRGIELVDQPDRLGAALDLVAASALSEGPEGAEDGAAPERSLVVLLSDGGTPAPPGLMLDNADWRFEGVGPGPEAGVNSANLGIAAVSARRDYTDPATVRVFARIVNAGAEPVATVLTLTLDGRTVDRRPLEVPASAGGAVSEVGEATVTFEFQDSAGGVAVVQIGRKDVLASDDAAGVVLGESGRPGVLVVSPEGPAADGPAWVLGDVLAEMDLSPLVTVSAGEYERLAATGGLGPYALVIFDRVRPRMLPPHPSISFGAGLPAPGAAPAEEPGPDGSLGAARFLSWDRSHPVFRDVSPDSTVIARTLDVLGSVGLGAGDGGSRTVTELARSERGPLIALLEDGQVRRLVVGFELAQSNWPLSVSFAIFLSNAIDFLTLRGEAEAGRAFTTTEPARVRVGADAAGEIVLRGPRVVRAGQEGGGGAVSVGVLDRAGVYVVEGAGAAGERAVAVNLVDQTESAVRTARELVIGGRPVVSSSGGAGPREVWPWFILAAAALLAVEWFLHAFMTRV